MARLEIVMMKPDCVTADLLETLSRQGVAKGIDQLSLWDTSRVRILRLPFQRLAKRLAIRADEMETLSENMVFWVLRSIADEPDRVIHATQAARQIVRVYYQMLTRTEG